MLGSSSSGKRLELPVTLKLFVNMLVCSWDKDDPDGSEPNIAAAWDESRIVVLLSRLFSLDHKPPDNVSFNVRGFRTVWLVCAAACPPA
jgi:hypothetical protein